MKKKKSKPKSTRIYDENGRWVEERGRVKGAIRRSFRLSPMMREVLNAARVELPPAILKDGSRGKKNQIRYKCAECQLLFQAKNVQVDHINPVTKLHMEDKDMSYDDMVRGVFCKVDNLQVLCSTKLKDLPKGERSCHGKKSILENFIRDRFNEWKKQGKLGYLSDSTVEQMTLEFSAMYDDHLEQKRLEMEAKELRKLLKLNKKK